MVAKSIKTTGLWQAELSFTTPISLKVKLSEIEFRFE